MCSLRLHEPHNTILPVKNTRTVASSVTLTKGYPCTGAVLQALSRSGHLYSNVNRPALAQHSLSPSFCPSISHFPYPQCRVANQTLRVVDLPAFPFLVLSLPLFFSPPNDPWVSRTGYWTLGSLLETDKPTLDARFSSKHCASLKLDESFSFS